MTICHVRTPKRGDGAVILGTFGVDYKHTRGLPYPIVRTNPPVSMSGLCQRASSPRPGTVETESSRELGFEVLEQEAVLHAARRRRRGPALCVHRDEASPGVPGREDLSVRGGPGGGQRSSTGELAVLRWSARAPKGTGMPNADALVRASGRRRRWMEARGACAGDARGRRHRVHRRGALDGVMAPMKTQGGGYREASCASVSLYDGEGERLSTCAWRGCRSRRR